MVSHCALIWTASSLFQPCCTFASRLDGLGAQDVLRLCRSVLHVGCLDECAGMGKLGAGDA